MCGLDPADLLMVEDDPGDALIAALGRLAWCGAVRLRVWLSPARGTGFAFSAKRSSMAGVTGVILVQGFALDLWP
jgi:hypothetical protein